MSDLSESVAEVKELHDEVIADRDERIRAEVLGLGQIVKALDAMESRGRFAALRYLMDRYRSDLRRFNG